MDNTTNKDASKNLQVLQEKYNIEVKPCNTMNIEDNPKYKRLDLTRDQKSQISALVGQLPSVAIAGIMSNAYLVKFPENLPNTLMKFKNGGVGSAIMGESGIVGQASFFQIGLGSLTVLAFSAMAFATGQYFLKQINSELNVLNSNIEKILDFLYGDKRAELVSEINFAQYAYQNYNVLMQNDFQRTAIIGSLQESRKVAIKDCEFYLDDLEKTVKNNTTDLQGLESDITKAFNIKKTLDASMDLYVTSAILEVYYSQNFDGTYLKYVEKDVSTYINKCEMVIHSAFDNLLKRINDNPDRAGNSALWMLPNKEPQVLPNRENSVGEIKKIIESLRNTEESEFKKVLHSSLTLPTENKDYCISADGDVYVKTS